MCSCHAKKYGNSYQYFGWNMKHEILFWWKWIRILNCLAQQTYLLVFHFLEGVRHTCSLIQLYLRLLVPIFIVCTHLYLIQFSISDDLKHILGSETSRTGLMLLFSMFQHEVLNKRLVYVFLEGFLVALFPNLKTFFQKLHEQSPRVSSRRKKKMKKWIAESRDKSVYY